jgi:hypothetical protein
MWTRWCWRARPSGPSPIRRNLKKHLRQPLTASELRTELAGHILYSDPMHIMHMSPMCCGHVTLFVAADGMLYGTLKAEPDLGTWHDVGLWHIAPDGQFCSR